MQDPPGVESVALRLSARALGLLFQHDPQFKVDLSTQVVQELSRKHLRTVLETTAFREWRDALAAAFKKEVAEQVGQVMSKGWRDDDRQVALTQEIAELVRGRVAAVVDQAVAEAFAAALTKNEAEAAARMERYEVRLMDKVTAKVKEIADTVNKLYGDLDAKVAARIDALARERVVAEAQSLLAAAAALGTDHLPKETP